MTGQHYIRGVWSMYSFVSAALSILYAARSYSMYNIDVSFMMLAVILEEKWPIGEGGRGNDGDTCEWYGGSGRQWPNSQSMGYTFYPR